MSNDEQALQQAITLCDNLKIATYFNALPLGFLTKVGEDGINLSGGQLQLVGLCRALYNNPAILLLDEPTNNMDKKTKALFWEIINTEKNQRICMIVSHEKEIIDKADKLIVLS